MATTVRTTVSPARVVIALSALCCGLAGFSGSLFALMHIPWPYSGLVVIAITAAGACLGWGLGWGITRALASLEARRKSSHAAIFLIVVVPIVLFAYGVGKVTNAGWHWAYPSEVELIGIYGNGCLAESPFALRHSRWVPDTPGSEFVTVTSETGQIIRFQRDPEWGRAGLTPADEHTRTVLTGLGCP